MIFVQNWILQKILIFFAIIWWPSIEVDTLHISDLTKGTKPHHEDIQGVIVHGTGNGNNKSSSYGKGPPSKPNRTSGFTGLIGDQALTHTEWVQLDQRSYKIYGEIISYEAAKQRCINHHPDAQLAVVTSFNHSQILGSYLSSGTPKLANAWIGARWYSEGYQFESEPIMLQNTSDRTGYPPWKYNKIQKSGSCILLDRHVAKITVFLEANCIRLRPYICYIQNNTGFTDLIRGDHAYRLHHNKRNWADARNYCKNVYLNYSAYLAEIREPKQLYDLLRLMRQKEPAVHRVWLGGIFNKSASLPTWVWDSNNTEIRVGPKSHMKWMHNSPYKSDDSCLVMDNSEMNYGMACKLEQSYVCQFSVASLKQLQDAEKKKKLEIHSKWSSPKKYEPHLCTGSSRTHSDCTGEEKSNKVLPFSTWIQADQRLYKIFNEEVSYNVAKEKCRSHHPDVELAVVPSLRHAQILGRHLLTNRSFLKAAWIGGRWIDDEYQFELESTNTSDTTYSNWNNKKMQMVGCIALNQNSSDGPLFVKSHCHHKRPYICYTENGTGFTDLIVGDNGYRLHHNKKNWSNAGDYCRDVYANYSAHIAEIEEPINVYYLIKLMEKYGRTTRHVWLGGALYKIGTQPLWFWDNTCEKIPVGPDSRMHWDNHTTYLSSMGDNCIAMDILGKTYGAACGYELNYVCQFSAERFRFLQRQEGTNN